MNIEDTWDGHMRRAPVDAAKTQREPASLALRAMQVFIALVCVWSLIETPWEVSPGDGTTRIAALLLAKCLLLAAGAAAFFGVRYARPVFAFLCGASVLAVASTLPFEYAISHELFTLSLIECVCKVALVASYAIWYLKKH
ncbi:hypothetical protein [Paraburkholderia phenazinium]|jgi:hypothetical protein|uniref:Uncharacterized protein n=1 Tax=Paraburkholderia phenazinium TaxID=60549 RepID=A0A1G7SS60_9BURK|nr:hypothetical protein [Paraburkholderia phenazinium]SDG25788.1 hypothetical protein SAMN05216466_102638 [Paraburkholderia phenazinium]